MTVAYIVAWWLCGTGLTLLLESGNPSLTWGRLLRAVFCGVMGPIILVMLAIVILIHASFWDKPVFRGKSR